LSELTVTGVGRNAEGEFNHAVYRLTDPEVDRVRSS
jgi:hypothetical protein